MTDPVNPEGLRRGLAEAEQALAAFAAGPARSAADSLSEAFERAGGRIANSLTRAAFSGELSFKQLARVALAELAKLAVNALAKNAGPLGGVAGGVLKALPFFGARAAGGSVTPGGAFLVGERGPELFTPGSAGAVSPLSAQPMSIHLHFNGPADAESFRRDQGQIAAAIARAAAYGRRNL